MTLCFRAFLKLFGELYCEFFCTAKKSLTYLLQLANFLTLLHPKNNIALSLAFTAFASYQYWQFLDHDVIVVDGFDNSTVPTNLSLPIACNFLDVVLVRAYLIGVNAIMALNFPLLIALIYHSARGSISDVKARQLVAPLLYLK